MRTLICTTALVSLLWTSHSLAQSAEAKDGASATGQFAVRDGYVDTTKGLKDLLDDMRSAAKDGDSARLRVLVASTEIPDYKNWFVKTFGAANGARWASAYGRTRARREAELQSEMMQLALQPGYFSAKEIVPMDVYDTLQTPLELFLANWSPPDVDGLKRRRTPIGYFFYIHGKFCWNTR